jgi:hypothetical protein
MRDAVNRSIELTAPNGKHYKLRSDGNLATLLVRYFYDSFVDILYLS